MNPQVHEIRLAGPWEVFMTDSNSWKRVRLPYAHADGQSSQLLKRRFHRPRGLSSTTQVLLVVEASESVERVSLNDSPLESTETSCTDSFPGKHFDLTTSLHEFNTIELSLPPTNDRRPVVLSAVRLRIVENGTQTEDVSKPV